MSGLDSHLEGWEPAPLTTTDALPAEQAHALAVVLDIEAPPAAGTALPPLWHWVYFQEWPRHEQLGPDGHPASGHFLPPIPDRRRMFAGGRLTVTEPLRIAEPTLRRSSLSDVTVKHGRSGEVAFVTLRSEFWQDDQLRMVEEQDYAYRSGEGPAKTRRPSRPETLPHSTAAWQDSFTGDPVRLFRFSALTANAHRIHYDSPYTREVESYPDLVVHGPLLALLMTELARAGSGKSVSTVDYRLHRPVFAGDPVLLTGEPSDEGADLAVLTAPENTMATATVGFA
ncbi:hypothetical protein GIY23_13725 [Allosaccharopolyspora coralli]|uniref:3-methylfumaryl-CoA hydratase n=1 Tax=Allosaccharopolyspora coralli TaxID=2665642 RepID=A0A5Q3Q7I9_9PSEU|nr:hypothetical protein [Allosaccharopolyspora coralli]QGK70442.1 hypothetical protein GIY23_13725 [Allosaccharopolyspora coralli]